MYFRGWVPLFGFYWFIIDLILIESAVDGKSVQGMHKEYNMLTADGRFSRSTGGYNDNYQYNGGYDYIGSSGNLGIGSRDSNYDNYGISHSSRSNYDGYGNSRKTGDFGYFGSSNSNSNMRHRDFDSSLYSTKNSDRSNRGWNMRESV